MPRANRRRDDHRPLAAGGFGETTTERYAGSLWTVRRVSGARATRTYLCPGCQQEIAVGTPHVVAWPADGRRRARGPAALAYRLLVPSGRPAGGQRVPLNAAR